MTAFCEKSSVRVAAGILFVLFLMAAIICGMLESYGRMNDWYYISSDAGFQATLACQDYVNDANYYVEQNVRWLEDMTLDNLGSYAGRAYSYVIRNAYGRIMADTRTGDSVLVSVFGPSPVPEPGFTVEGYINLPIEPYDGCYREYLMFEMLFGLRYLLIVLKILFYLLTAASLGTLAIGTAARGRKGLLRPSFQKPFDAVLIADVTVFLLAYLVRALVMQLIWDTWSWGGNNFRGWWIGTIGNSVGYALFLLAGAFLIWYAAGQLGAGMLGDRLFIRRLPPSVVIISVLLLHIVLLYMMHAYYRSYYAGSYYLGDLWYMATREARIILVLIDIALAPLLIRYAAGAGRISRAASEISGGNLSYKTDVKRLHFVWRALGERLNSIGEGMSQAVDDRMRSERMKTELITNVSHDLKTPLTSIINYVGLLKTDGLSEEEKREYLAILDRQSAKLKKLTDDVLEASKAASGALNVHREPIDAVELLEQFVGEYSGRLEEAEITPVLSHPEGETLILADSTLLGRVLENLITNVVKYALPGTRAYFDICKEAGRVLLTVKNVSRDPLNITADELMGRFVRGDSSRHSEGSGLGLSIASSLTELMGGTLTLTLDGDLFKAELSLETVQMKMEGPL